MTKSRWAEWEQGTLRTGLRDVVAEASTAAALDMGNPTSAESGMTPADKARAMGFISDGNGNYKDAAGNTVARTVNGELVYYDSRAGGGAISDGSGGAELTQAQPSWVDPVTGMIIVPPGQPESPEEVNAVPDPVPAQAPAGYEAFMNRRRKEMYAQNSVDMERQAAIDAQQAEDEALSGSRDVLNPPTPTFEEFVTEIRGNLTTDDGEEVPFRDTQVGPQLQTNRLQSLPVPQFTNKGIRAKRAGGEARKAGTGMFNALMKRAEKNELSDEDNETLTTMATRHRGSGSAEEAAVNGILSRAPRSTPQGPKRVTTSRTPDTEQPDGTRVGRRADHIWDTFGHLTELPTEAASMQAIHELLSDKSFGPAVEHLNLKPNSPAFRRLPEDTQKLITELHRRVEDVVPTAKSRDGNVATGGVRTAQAIMQHLQEQFPKGVPPMSIMKPFESNSDMGMRLNNIPDDATDSTYDRMHEALTEKLGGDDNLLRRVMDIRSSDNVRDKLDPTDITLTQQGREDDIIGAWQEALDDIEDGPMTDDKLWEIINTRSAFIDLLSNQNLLRNVSLKAPKDGNDVSAYLNPMSSRNMPPVKGLGVDYNLDMGNRSEQLVRGRGLPHYPTFNFANQGITANMQVGDRQWSVPFIPHPGPGPLGQNPHGTAGSLKTEPSASGAGAKIKAIPTRDWIGDHLNNLSPGLLDIVGNLNDHLGVDDRNNMIPFTDEDMQYWVDKEERLKQHTGAYSYPEQEYAFGGQNSENLAGHLQQIRGLDDIIHHEDYRSDEDDFSADETDLPINHPTHPLDDNLGKKLSRYGRDQIREYIGEGSNGTHFPTSGIRQNIRRKLQGMRWLDLLQQLETLPVEQRNQFFQEQMYNHAMSINPYHAPYWITGS